MLIWQVLNFTRDSKQQPYPFELDEVMQFLGHAPAPVEEPEKPSVEELGAKLAMLSSFYGSDTSIQE